MQKRSSKIDYDKYDDYEGQLLISVIEGKNLITKNECNPYVNIVLSPKFYDKKGEERKSNIEKLQYETQVIQNSKNPLWVGEEHPIGRLFDLGQFNKSKDSQIITF